LYLIDDKGNKAPLSYKNNNLNSIQKLFQPSSRAEVVFLGNNTQNVYDNYPIVRSGVKTDKIVNIYNDILFYNDPNLYVNNSTCLPEINTGKWNIRSFFNNRNFSSSLNNDGTIRLKFIASLYTGDYDLLDNNQISPAQQSSDTLGPWWIILYNQENNKVFENTELETTIDISFRSQTQNVTPNFLYFPSIKPSSEIISLPSNIKIGDTLILKKYNTVPANIGTLTTFLDVPVPNSLEPDIITSYKITNIKFPGPIDTTNILNPVNLPASTPGWRLTSKNSAFVFSVPSINRASSLKDGFINYITSYVGGGTNNDNFAFVFNKTLNTVNYASLLSTLKIGDLIKFRDITDPDNIELQFNMMVILNGGLYPGSSDHYLIYTQLMNGYSSPILVDNSNLTNYEIYNVTKFDYPFIDLKNNLGSMNSSILNSNITNKSAWSFTRDIPHEQYIESQFLSGSGVGVIIPEDYNPALRDILPDIIKKTQIDINSLIQ
jgi:hypothetical protein